MAVARDSKNAPMLGDIVTSSWKTAFAVFLTASTTIGRMLSKPSDSSMGTSSKAGPFRRNDLPGRFLYRPRISRRSPSTAVKAS